jgi:hypothetical protein
VSRFYGAGDADITTAIADVFDVGSRDRNAAQTGDRNLSTKQRIYQRGERLAESADLHSTDSE